MILHNEITAADLRSKIKQGKIGWAGNQKLKIYGTLSCASGKRLKRENRVFFSSENEALNKGYRPCGHCMKEHYQKWNYLTLSLANQEVPALANKEQLIKSIL